MPGSEGPWFRPAVQDVSRQCPSSQGVHQLSWTTQIRFEGPRHHQLSRPTRARVRVPTGSIALLGDSGPCPRSCTVDQLSRATRARVQWPAVSISCLKRLGTVNKVPQCQSDFLGDSGPGPIARGVNQLSCVTQARVRSPAGSTCFPGHIGPLSKACGGDQMSLAIWPRVRGPVGLTSCPGPLALWSEDQVRAAVPYDVGPCPRFSGVHHLSRVTHALALVPGPAGTTSCHGCPGTGSEDLRCRPSLPGDSGQ